MVLLLLLTLILVTVAVWTRVREDARDGYDDAPSRIGSGDDRVLHLRIPLRLPRRPKPPLPAADLPPGGLCPLIPSPRNVEAEFTRGLADLTLYLATRRTA